MTLWGRPGWAGTALVAALVTGAAVLGGCSFIAPFSCTKEGSAASDRLVDDLKGLSSVTSAEVIDDCDSGGENYVHFGTTSAQAGRDEFTGLTHCRPGDPPNGEPADKWWPFECDFPSGHARVLLARNQAKDSNQVVVRKPRGRQ
jgi:hypothetical protein